MTTKDENCYYDFTTDDTVIGSTYLVKIELNGTSAFNYKLFDAETFYESGKEEYKKGSAYSVLKYKTVILGNKYYTIEDALKETGDIVLAGNSSTTIFTAFTSFKYYNTALTYVLDSNENIWITYNGNKTLKSNETGSVIFSCLFIPNNVILNANGTINVCGSYQKMTHKVLNHGVLFNNGTINLYGTLNSYGFTKGIGTINSLQTSKIYDLMVFYNYANSGGITLSLSNAKIFPMSAYSIHNVSCKVNVAYTATYYVFYDVEIADNSISGDLVLMGNKGLFQLSNGYLEKSVEDTTSDFYIDKGVLKTNYSKTNQDITQRDVIDIYGNFEDNIINITTKALGIMEVGIKTGTDYAMPFGFMRITLKKGCTGTLEANSYKFLPGSVLTIEDGATLNIGGSSHIVFYDESYDKVIEGSYYNLISYYHHHKEWYSQTIYPIDAQLIVNGNLACSGYLGGYIKTSSTTGFIQLTHNYAKIRRLISETYGSGSGDSGKVALGGTTADYDEPTVYATGNIDMIDNTQFDTGPYISRVNTSNIYYWTSSKDAKKFTIIFRDSNGSELSRKDVYVLTAVNNKYSYYVSGTEFNPSKSYYVFENWLLSTGEELSENNNELYYNVTSGDGKYEIELFATWTPITYHFEYYGIYIDPVTSENIILTEEEGLILQNKNLSFTYEDLLNGTINITTKSSYSSLNVTEWYINIQTNATLINYELTREIFESLSANELNENVQTKTGFITLFSRFSDVQEYIIKYDLDSTLIGYSITPSTETFTTDSTLELFTTITKNYNSNSSYQYYLDYWSFDPNKINIIDNNISSIGDLVAAIKAYDETLIVNNTITLYSKSVLKPYSVTFMRVDFFGNEFNKTISYYNPNEQYVVPTSFNIDNYVLNTGQGQGGVEYIGATPSNDIIIVNSIVTIKVHYYKIITLTFTKGSSTDGVSSASFKIDKTYDSATNTINTTPSGYEYSSSTTITTIQGATVISISVKSTYIIISTGTASINFYNGEDTYKKDHKNRNLTTYNNGSDFDGVLVDNSTLTVS